MRNNLKAVRRNGKALTLGVALSALGAGLFGAAQPAQATPAGLTFYPSTDIYGRGNFHFDSDTFLNQDNPEFGAFGTSIGLEYGTGPDRDGLFGRSEFGFDYLTGAGDLDVGRRFLFNAKTQLFNSDPAQTRVVAGFWGAGAEEAFAPNIVYLLGSKNFPKVGRFHVGVARSLQDEDTIGEDRTNLQLGYDRVFANGKLQFTLDYMTGDTAYSVLAPGLIYYINDKAAVQVGYIRPNEKSIAGPDQIYLAFDYNFTLGSSTEAAPAETAPAPAPETSTTSPATQ